MVNSSEIREHMEVVGSDGQHIGTVDRVEGNRIKLTKSDTQTQQHHHIIGLDLVDRVEQNTVQLNVTSEEAQQQKHDDQAMSDDAAMTAGGGATGSAEAKGGKSA
ncbi:MAG: DUF2171 domain-containing protein [Acidobacteriota bacterium]|nr:DUF2171 domain-containing protein [Acidobacteriota bacterium]